MNMKSVSGSQLSATKRSSDWTSETLLASISGDDEPEQRAADVVVTEPGCFCLGHRRGEVKMRDLGCGHFQGSLSGFVP
jgi:hypothetical protein